jgi:hypothetical protein
MSTLLTVHSIQVLSLIATIFWIREPAPAYKICLLFDGVVVFIFYIYIAIATGVTNGC